MVKRPTKPSKQVGNDPHADRESRQYEQPIASREHILALIEDATALTRRQLITRLNLKGAQPREALRRRLRAMERDGQLIFRRRDECYVVPSAEDLVQGCVEAHRDGYGFLLLEGEEDIYLNEREMRKVFHGDEVLVRPVGRSRRGGVEGRIESVVRRARSCIVGRFNRESGVAFIAPDNPRICQDILISKDSVIEADIGDYVSVRINQYPTQRSSAVGEIIEVLGAPLSPGLEIDIAIRSHDLPQQWSEEALIEVAALDESPEEADKHHRVDLRNLPLVTIDGEDARDFDDAVYCEKRRGGGFTLWVAIADVSHYVPVDSALDRQAYERGTSVYFPGRVLPMLPEKISNGLCSLMPEVDRLCLVCEMTISSSGKVTGQKFYEAVMHSQARLTYDEVAEALELLPRSPRAGLLQRLQNLLPGLNDLHALYQCLRKARVRRGAVDFDSSETKIIFNHEKKIEIIEPVVRHDAHKMIEECMLCANVAAAEFLAVQNEEVLYRVHNGPKEQKLDNLRLYLAELGLSLAGGLTPQPKDYQVLMQQVEQRPDAHLIQIMLLRSLSQAVYQPDNQGHFGLAYPAYLHFTSPIRRYPDLLTHRAIRRVIRSRAESDQVRRVRGAVPLAKKTIYPYEMEEVVAAGLHCSMAERRADEVTRDVTAWLKCEYLQDRIGERFSGVIAGVTGFGLFVELKDLFVEGLVHINSLGQEYYRFDQAQQRLVGERSRHSYCLGDDIAVVVAAVDLDARKIDLALADVASAKGVSAKSRAAKKPVKKKSRVPVAGGGSEKGAGKNVVKKKGVANKKRRNEKKNNRGADKSSPKKSDRRTGKAKTPVKSASQAARKSPKKPNKNK